MFGHNIICCMGPTDPNFRQIKIKMIIKKVENNKNNTEK